MRQTVARDDARTELGSFGNKLLGGFLLLSDLAVALLQPALGGMVFVLALVLGKGGEESGDSVNRSCLALLGGLVTGRDPSKGRPRRKKREKVGRQLVRHGDAGLVCGRSRLAKSRGRSGGSGIAVRCQRHGLSSQVKKLMNECQERSGAHQNDAGVVRRDGRGAGRNGVGKSREIELLLATRSKRPGIPGDSRRLLISHVR